MGQCRGQRHLNLCSKLLVWMFFGPLIYCKRALRTLSPHPLCCDYSVHIASPCSFSACQPSANEFCRDLVPNHLYTSMYSPCYFLRKASPASHPVARLGLCLCCVACRVRACLHLVLCFSPVGDAFRQRLRMFPSLVNCTTIDWFSEWPLEALTSVAKSFLADVEVSSTNVAARSVHPIKSLQPCKPHISSSRLHTKP